MISDGRVGWHSVDHVTIRLIVSEVPIVILVAVLINVVAGRQDQPYAEFINSLFQRLADLPLAPVFVLLNSYAKISDDGTGERYIRRLRRIRMCAEAILIRPAFRR